MIYLDNAATTLKKPDCVKEAVLRAMDTFGNASRGTHTPALDALRMLMEARIALASLFGLSADPMRVVFTLNATLALNIAIAGIKGHIVTTSVEHNSVLRPVYRHGNYTIVPCDALGCVSTEAISSAIQPDTEAVVLTHASNVTGNVFDIQSVGKLCAAQGLHFIVDASQSAGLLPIDMKNISALCFTGHKSLFGPQGTGGLCLGPDYMPESLYVGGSGHHSFDLKHPQQLPDALEAGTQNAHGIAGLLAGVQYIQSTGLSAIHNQADTLARLFAHSLADIPGVTLYGDLAAPLRTPVVSLNIEGYDSAQAAGLLFEKYGIAVRAGTHCAPLIHDRLSLSGSIRFSFSHFNTREETQLAIDAVCTLANR
ncbi:aminotransferase class V-fold PLP-dependent enzyme [Desulfosporosinus sp. PR]|uniref:aminotransferase class V-fold PLP-dependent enzyme n=1 Tax=Candidatus Desulfosporosinus nitrosoreducens TaxID=3401928 RepID=UPI0027F9529A|nr:aminotransferase class V-fold PLP-dependent enzyme [Desulfosporosinus sp. PR]MDQ7095293.1 aminotransferase class V-fold PLP-dependent enzyme [Desulfosporosinus sp. PR]